MTPEQRIAEVRRRAKSLSRAGDLSHQQALDHIAREEGHRHWGAMLASLKPSGERPEFVREVRRDPPPTTWKTELLDRASGAKARRYDELLIRIIGRPAAAILGTGYRVSALGSAILVLVLCLVSNRFGSRPEWDAGDVYGPIIALGFALIGHVACYHHPDDSRLRAIRRRIVWVAAFLTMMTVVTEIPVMLGSVMKLAKAPSNGFVPILAAATALLVPMYVAVYAGRRRRASPERRTPAAA